MSETLQPIYVPCEVLRVRAMVSAHDVLTPIEKLAIEVVGKSCAARAAPTFSDLVQMFGLGERPTLDLVRDLWSEGLFAVSPQEGRIYLTAPTRRRLDQHTLGEVQATGWQEEQFTLLRELITGHIVRVLPFAGQRSGFMVPECVPVSGGRLTEEQQAELSLAVAAMLRNSWSGLPRKLVRAKAEVTPEGMSPPRRVIRLRARVSHDPHSGELRFEITQPAHVPALVRLEMSRQLDRAAQADPEAYVFKNIAARVAVSADVHVEPLERSLYRLRQRCHELQTAPASEIQNLHHDCVAAAREVLRYLGARAAPAPAVEVVSGAEAFYEAVRHAIRTAREQVVLACPFATWDGYERFRQDLEDAVRRQVRVFVLWAELDGKELDDRFARGLMQLRAAARTGIVHRTPKSADVHAKVVIRDGDFAAIGSANFLGDPGKAAEVAVVVQSTRDREPSELVTGLLDWVRRRTVDPTMREAISVPAVEKPTVDLSLPERPAVDSVAVYRLQWAEFLADVEAIASRIESQCTLLEDEDHRPLLLRAIREARWRVLASSDRFGDGALDAAVEHALRQRLQEGLPVALVWRRARAEDAYSTALATRLEELAAEFPTTLTLISGASNHAKVLVWDDQAVVSSYNFLSFRGIYRGRRHKKSWGEVGIQLLGAPVADGVVAVLREQLDGALDRWNALYARPEPDGDSTATDHSGSGAARQVRHLLKRLGRAGPNPTARRGAMRSFFDAVDAPGAVLELLERPGIMEADDLHMACLCALRRVETRSHAEAGRWLSDLAAERWMERDFFAVAVLRGAIEQAAAPADARLPTRGAAFLSAVSHHPETFASRLIDVWTSRQPSEFECASAIAAYVLASTGSPDVATVLTDAEPGVSESLGRRLCELLVSTWWSATMGPLPVAALEEAAHARLARREQGSAREAVISAMRKAGAIRWYEFPRAAMTTAEALFGESGRLASLIAAVERENLERTQAELLALRDPEAVLQEIWAASRTRPERLESPLHEKLLRPLEAVVRAARAWVEMAAPTSNPLADHELAALDGLGRGLDALWPELEAAAEQVPAGPLFWMCLNLLEPVRRWRAAD